MADNTSLNAMTGGDIVRDVAKTVNSPAKTQMVIVDIGGGVAGSPEVAFTGAPVPAFFSSTAALGVGASVRSTTFDVSNGQLWMGYSAASVTQLAVQFWESADNVNFIATDSYTVAANSTGNYSYHKASGRYTYLVFTNLGASNPGGIGSLAIFVSQSAYAAETDVGVAGIANASNPSPNEGASQPLSLDLAAKLRTRDDNLLGYSVVDQFELLGAMLKEMRVMNELLKQGLNVHDELDVLRNDVDLTLSNSL